MRGFLFGVGPLALGVLSAANPAAAAPSVERGEYLVQGPAGCGNCHTPIGPQGFDTSHDLSGRLVDKNPAFTAIAPNITPAGRVAGWSDAELSRAIREGIRPDGSLIGPPMPFTMYRGLGDEDLASIVMYLRTVPAVENDPGKSEYKIPLPPAYGTPVASNTPPARGVTAEYGAYLAGPISHCMECHTPMGPEGPLVGTRLGAGGFEFVGPWGVSVAANLTSGPDGLQDYSDDEVKVMITQGRRPDGSPMHPPMPYGYLAKMTPDDLDAILLYLRGLPALPDHE
ncbi:cytochrome C [Paracoccus sp. NGMCC 1.201697]|uniref:Cytochrome C n=1 Tax=Paracoccus broussonetiae subsp. drimophilus TaxID=3373869 RepID=A0ABW7LK39_9RHOB